MRYRIKDKGLSKTHEKVEVPQSYPTPCNPMDYIACQAPLSMDFSRQEYWSLLSFPSPWDLSDLRIKPGHLALWTDSLPSEPPGIIQVHGKVQILLK